MSKVVPRGRGLEVTARHLIVVFDSVYLIALTSLVGSILFLSFCVAPLIFRVLGEEAAGAFVRALFPRYYQWGVISSALALPSAVAGPLCFPELRGPSVGVQALVIIAATLTMLYAGNSLAPAINAARDAGTSGRARFDRLHGRSVRLNGLVLLMGLGLLIAFAARPRPKTPGIVEPSPSERAEAQAKFLRKVQAVPPRPASPGR